MIMKKKFPIGIENLAEIRTEDFYYADKTGLVRALLYGWGKVDFFTRPRRFGKSLNMSMLKSFFEIGCDKSFLTDWKLPKKQSFVRNIGKISCRIGAFKRGEFGFLSKCP